MNSTIRENINILSKNKFDDQLIRKILKVSCIEKINGIEEKLQSRLVNNLRKYNDMILIVVSHRDSLLNLCDEIIEVSDL